MHCILKNIRDSVAQVGLRDPLVLQEARSGLTRTLIHHEALCEKVYWSAIRPVLLRHEYLGRGA